MGEIKIPKPVQYFGSILFSDEGALETCLEDLSDIVGTIVDRTGITLFDQTDYYGKEMGERIMRVFVLFSPLKARDMLSDVKVNTNAIEDSYRNKGKRVVNIDPGYISLENIILATTKGYAHRIYLAKGVYGDLTLMYSDGSFRALPWTYPDYAGKPITDLLGAWRERYKKELACLKV